MEVDYRHYQYNIAIPPFDQEHPISKALVPYWRSFWNKTLSDIESEEKINEEEIHWQNRITYITHKENIAAVHFIARYKTSEFSQSKYALKYLPEEVINTLQSFNQGYINTLQYLSVNPMYSQRKTGISFASIMSDISTLQHQELKAGQTLSVIRKSVGMHNMARKVGFKELCSINRHGEDSVIMHNTAPKRHPNRSIKLSSDYLWENRKFISKKEFAI